MVRRGPVDACVKRVNAERATAKVLGLGCWTGGVHGGGTGGGAVVDEYIFWELWCSNFV